MEVDTVVTLADGKKYLLLLEDDYMEEDYFLSVLLNDKDEPTDEYILLKEIIKDGKVYSQRVKDPVILSELLKDYRLQYEDEYETKNA